VRDQRYRTGTDFVMMVTPCWPASLFSSTLFFRRDVSDTNPQEESFLVICTSITDPRVRLLIRRRPGRGETDSRSGNAPAMTIAHLIPVVLLGRRCRPTASLRLWNYCHCGQRIREGGCSCSAPRSRPWLPWAERSLAHTR
jgi:hypothetical protein